MIYIDLDVIKYMAADNVYNVKMMMKLFIIPVNFSQPKGIFALIIIYVISWYIYLLTFKHTLHLLISREYYVNVVGQNDL
jgi:hypothetical protein